MRLIDADGLSKTIKETCLLAKPWDYVLIEQTIADAPTIEERKKGKWLITDSHEPCWYKCDQCGRLYDFLDNYCPNCGARMER